MFLEYFSSCDAVVGPANAAGRALPHPPHRLSSIDRFHQHLIPAAMHNDTGSGAVVDAPHVAAFVGPDLDGYRGTSPLEGFHEHLLPDVIHNDTGSGAVVDAAHVDAFAGPDLDGTGETALDGSVPALLSQTSSSDWSDTQAYSSDGNVPRLVSDSTDSDGSSGTQAYISD